MAQRSIFNTEKKKKGFLKLNTEIMQCAEMSFIYMYFLTMAFSYLTDPVQTR